jgi:hypothetical protein
MSSEIKVDTISENTSANGVAIDSLAIKDGKITNLMNATLSAADLGTGIHIKTADSSGDVHTSADNLVIEDSGDSGMTILGGTGNHSRINFGDSGDNDIGQITYDHGANAINIKTNASGSIYIDADGHVTMARQPAFSARNNATQSNIDNNTLILFGAETFDIGSNFASDHTFTAPVTGKYQLNAMVRMDNLDSSGTWVAMTIQTSNRNYTMLNSASTLDTDSGFWTFTVTALADLDANDTANVLFNKSGGSATGDATDGAAHFNGFLAC